MIHKYSPGAVLKYHTIETVFGFDHVKYYDFCAGESKHKELFTDEHKLCADIIYFPLNPKYLFIDSIKLIYDIVGNGQILGPASWKNRKN